MRVKVDLPSTNERDPLGTRPDGSPFRVLVVDDSMFIAKQISQILTSEGFEVAGTASDGEAAVETYKQLDPNVDLVTMDITMRKMGGVAVLEKIVKFDSRARMIMISALGKQDLVKKALLLGAKNHIVKPLDREKVLESIVDTLKDP